MSPEADPPRQPPPKILRELRREVGFGCPVKDCGSPYLEWNHFDPPWRERHHHEPQGMIALCAEHHAKADAGAFTKDQLRKLKTEGRQRAEAVRGKFDWMRNDLLAVIGGNLYFNVPAPVAFRGEPVIWFNRDEDRRFLLNLRMLSTSPEPRATIEDNFWVIHGPAEDVEYRLMGGGFASATQPVTIWESSS